MFLSRKVDNNARVVEHVSMKHEHSSKLHLAPLACGLICRVIVWECLLELQGNTLTHYPNSVDRINERLAVCAKKITLCLVDHQKYQPHQIPTPGLPPCIIPPTPP